MFYAIFTRSGNPRVLHAVPTRRQATVYADGRRGYPAVLDAATTVCGMPIGTGSGLVRDGNYADSVPCPRCWDRKGE